MDCICELCVGERDAEYMFMGIPSCQHCINNHRLEDKIYVDESFEDFLRGNNIKKI